MSRSLVTGLVHKRDYPGESDDKRAARLFVYKYAIAAPRVGHMVALIGTVPHEADLAMEYLCWPAERAHFVDWARDVNTRKQVLAALRETKRRYPRADVVRGDLHDVILDLPLIGFANLDFMGFTRDSVMPCVKETLARLAVGGIMAVTWYRCREIDAPHRSAWDVLEAARDVADVADRRWAGVLRLVARWAGERGVVLELLGAMEYQHNHSPMSVVVWRRKLGGV